MGKRSQVQQILDRLDEQIAALQHARSLLVDAMPVKKTAKVKKPRRSDDVPTLSENVN